MAVKNTRWYRVQYMLGAFKLERMPCVWTTLKTGYDVVLWCEYIHQFSFALVAPLKPEEYIYFVIHGLKKKDTRK
jgi:hypothetical protein